MLNLNMARNMKKEPQKVGGGRRGGRKDRGDTRERNEKPALIQNMGSIFAEKAQEKESWRGRDICMHTSLILMNINLVGKKSSHLYVLTRWSAN